MTVRAREIAGLSAVCKTVRAGFDSLPRLHFFIEWPRRGLRFPDDYSKGGLFRLVMCHHAEHVEAKRKYIAARNKLIAAQKELSALKRARNA